MLVTERERLREELVALADRHGRRRSALLPILEEVQRRHFRISEYCMQVIADLLDIHPVEVHSVVSFYSFLGEEALGQYVIRLCRTITCDMAGKEHVARQLENDLGIQFGETTPDGKFSLRWANCLGMCDQGPALLVTSGSLPASRRKEYTGFSPSAGRCSARTPRPRPRSAAYDR
jgi:NADH:ubiquinone oxidoreductase subunit E